VLKLVKTLDQNCKSGSKIGCENCSLGLEKVGKWLGILLCLKSGNPVLNGTVICHTKGTSDLSY